MAKFIDPEKLDLEDNVVAINRITKVVKGGRRLRFAALVVVGDHNGHVGFGTGKAQEVPEAIRKAVEAARKNLIEVPIVGTTIPHEVLGTFGGGKIMLKLLLKVLGLLPVVPFVPSWNWLVSTMSLVSVLVLTHQSTQFVLLSKA